MVGRETFVTLIQGLPATSDFVFFVSVSGPDTGRASGIFPLQTGVWLRPEYGCDPCAIADVVASSTANDRPLRVRTFMGLFPFIIRITSPHWKEWRTIRATPA